ncbi:MAG TPA: arsenate reductase ArsC [Nitrospiria bacterium]|nr:arsenate reductase ArsC [Nitrospiria bacterium]
MTERIKVIFLCTGNSARSQMAEGLARHLSKGRVDAYSAGLEPKGLHPLAVAAMDEIGIDIRSQKSKDIDPKLFSGVDLIITLCGDAEARCPVSPPHIRREHWPLEDPARAVGSEEERREAFRKTRDRLRERIIDLLEEFR